jgi:hypothetical protein
LKSFFSWLLEEFFSLQQLNPQNFPQSLLGQNWVQFIVHCPRIDPLLCRWANANVEGLQFYSTMPLT